MSGVSVVIPVHDQVDPLRRAVGSALAQNVDVQVIVVDDGSRDGSAQVARSFGSRIDFLRQDNQGPSAARNRGAREAVHPVLAFLDADDELLPGCLAAHLACRQAHPRTADVTLAPFRSLVGEFVDREVLFHDRPVELIEHEPFRYAERFQTALARGLVGSSLCVTRELFADVGGFDPQLQCWEISDLMYRLLVRRPVVGILPEVSVIVHASYTEGQWARNHRQLCNRVIHSRNILDHLELVPRDQWAGTLVLVQRCLDDLLTLGSVDEFRSLAQHLGVGRDATPELRRLHALGSLPGPLVRSWSLLRRGARLIGFEDRSVTAEV